VHQSFGIRGSAPRRAVALLGVFAILLQATLFAGHRHPFPLSVQGAPALLTGAPATGPAPGLADDDCQICFALSHHSAAPVDWLATPSGHLSLPPTAVEVSFAQLARYLHFRSRAPPRT
jgi:hypothetical protein